MLKTSPIDIVRNVANEKLFSDTLLDAVDGQAWPRTYILLRMMRKLREREDLKPGYLRQMVSYVDARIEDGALTEVDGKYRI